jgi:hypothetical protein
MNLETRAFTEVQPWDFETLEAEFERRKIDGDGSAHVPKHRLLGLYEARRPFEDYRGKVSWAQTVITDHPDARFARFGESQLYTAHVPIGENAPSEQQKGRLSSYVIKKLRRRD